MSAFFSKHFGRSEDLAEIYAQGAVIVDVRTPEEFAAGHIDGALNIPVNILEKSVDQLRVKNKPVITCCRSGARSGLARVTLAAAGVEAYNGGPWDSLEKKINKG